MDPIDHLIKPVLDEALRAVDGLLEDEEGS